MAKRRRAGSDLSLPDKEGPASLRSAWARLHGSEAPPALTADLLRRDVAYREQADRHGGLSPKLQKRLAVLAAGAAGTPSRPGNAPIQIKPGSTFLREWRGRTYTVLAADAGFEMAGQRFATLSAIARHITGAHWSGPRFFGLRRAARACSTDA